MHIGAMTAGGNGFASAGETSASIQVRIINSAAASGTTRKRPPPDMLETDPALSTEAPIDSTTRHHDAGDQTTELLLQGWTPRYKLEAEAIIDHREPA